MHISCVTPDWVWVSDLDGLQLSDKSGAYLHELRSGKLTAVKDRAIIM